MELEGNVKSGCFVINKKNGRSGLVTAVSAGLLAKIEYWDGEGEDDTVSVLDLVLAEDVNIHYCTENREILAIESFSDRRAVARWNPEDEFDFYIGAQVALARLFGREIPKDLFQKKEEPEKKEEVFDTYKEGEIVVCINRKSIAFNLGQELKVVSDFGGEYLRCFGYSELYGCFKSGAIKRSHVTRVLED